MARRREYRMRWWTALATWLAWHLPREVVYWCAVRVAVNASQGKWSGSETPGVTVVEMLERWDY